MSGTPSISDSYAIVGNQFCVPPVGRSALRLSAVVLPRGPWMFRPAAVVELTTQGFSDVLVVEEGVPRYDVDQFASQHPGVRFLVGREHANAGVRINQAAREVKEQKFLVLWDDQGLTDAGPKQWRGLLDSNAVATAPERRDAEGREIPGVLVPGLEQDRLKILALGADQESVDTLFPADYTAVYDRQRFLQTGGYDPELHSSFWQKADWGLRSRLWGETLTVEKSFRVDYRSHLPSEDQTPDRSYPRFFLRNLAVRHLGDHGILPWTKFWSHARRTGLPLTEALSGFLAERAWVHRHRYRFQSDARLLTELWGTT